MGLIIFPPAAASVHFAAGNQVLSLIKHLGHKLIIVHSLPLPASVAPARASFPSVSSAEYSPFLPALISIAGRAIIPKTDRFGSRTVRLRERNTPDYFRRITFSTLTIEFRKLSSRHERHTVFRAASLPPSLSLSFFFFLNGR